MDTATPLLCCLVGNPLAAGQVAIGSGPEKRLILQVFLSLFKRNMGETLIASNTFPLGANQVSAPCTAHLPPLSNGTKTTLSYFPAHHHKKKEKKKIKLP